MSHPTHPATVHFPITTTLLTGALDAGYWLATSAPTRPAIASAIHTLGIAIPPTDFPVLSYYTTLLTLLFALPAIATGAYELYPVIRRDGLASPKARTGVAHALLNDLTTAAAAYNWWSRRNVPGFVPSGGNVFLSAVAALPVTLWSAYLGGSLVYVYGMGFRGGQARGKAKKAQ
ncbi:hypothetical protein ACN47E_009435 [Coniothyrium glycines]